MLSLTNSLDLTDKETLDMLNSSINTYLEKNISSYLYKTSKEFKSDIDLFGRYAVKYFGTWDKWLEYNWLDNYQNSFFDVNVDLDVVSSYLIS